MAMNDGEWTRQCKSREIRENRWSISSSTSVTKLLLLMVSVEQTGFFFSFSILSCAAVVFVDSFVFGGAAAAAE